MLEKVLLLLILLSWLYWIIASILVARFFRKGESNPSHQSSTNRQPYRFSGLIDDNRQFTSHQSSTNQQHYLPSISILKPVRGVDTQAYWNFVSFCQQDYPRYELLFGVDEPDDPVVSLIELLQHDFPDRDIHLIFTRAGVPNRKANILHYLAEAANNEVLVISDSDMRVTPDYLHRVVAPLADEQVGVVTCPYRGSLALTFPARLEALHMGVTFLPAVIVARYFLRMRFAMGATMAMRREDLKQVGGFSAVSNYLADDYEIAIRIADLGRKNKLSDYVIVNILGATTFRQLWEREVRWSRCNRVNRPAEYPGYLMLFCVPMALALLVVANASPLAWQVLGFSLALRWLIAWFVTILTGDEESRRWLILLPVRDLFSVLVWFMGAFSRRVKWRGDAYLVSSDG